MARFIVILALTLNMCLTVSYVNASLTGKKVGIDPGHGSINSGTTPDPGAVGCCNEGDFTLAASLVMRDYVVNDGGVAVMTSTWSVRPSLSNRVQIFNSNNVNVSVCVHNNSASATAHGVETFYCSSNAQAGESKIFAGKVLATLLAEIKNDTRGVKECLATGRGFHFAMTRDPVCVAMLAETYFISNPTECADIIKSTIGRAKCGKAYYHAVCDYYSLTHNDNLGTGTDTTPPGVPVLLSPVGNSTIYAAPLFDWSDVTDPSGVVYQLQVSNTNTFAATVVNQQALASSQYKLAAGIANGTYYWRARAVDKAGNQGAWSTAVTFVVQIVTDSIAPQNPTDITAWTGVNKTTEVPDSIWQNASNMPYFEWSGATDTISGVDGYSIYWGTNSVGVPPEEVETLNPYYQTTTAVAVGKTFYFRICTKDVANNWSAPETLYVIKYSTSSVPNIASIEYNTKITLTGKTIAVKARIFNAGDVLEKSVEYYVDDHVDNKHINPLELSTENTNDGTVYVGNIDGTDIVAGTSKIRFNFVLETEFYGTIVSDTQTITIDLLTQKTLGANGGILKVEDWDDTDGETRLYVPSGVLSNNVLFTIKQENVGSSREVPPAVNNAFMVTTNAVPIVASEFGPTGQVFAQPVEVSLAYYSVASTVSEDNLRMFWYDGFQWRYIGGIVDKEKKIVTAKVNHFSMFAVFEVGSTKITAAEFKPREKIITPDADGKNDYAVFSGLNDAAKYAVVNGDSGGIAAIYNVKGKKVKEITDTDMWDGTDDTGSPVENGVYIYQFSYNESKVFGTIVVAR
ncbi:MAG: N-acetylmuramoyl-L-alanine amidase [Elusimicrobiota bacterium]